MILLEKLDVAHLVLLAVVPNPRVPQHPSVMGFVVLTQYPVIDFDGPFVLLVGALVH